MKLNGIHHVSRILMLHLSWVSRKTEAAARPSTCPCYSSGCSNSLLTVVVRSIFNVSPPMHKPALAVVYSIPNVSLCESRTWYFGPCGVTARGGPTGRGPGIQVYPGQCGCTPNQAARNHTHNDSHHGRVYGSTEEVSYKFVSLTARRNDDGRRFFFHDAKGGRRRYRP